MTIFSKLFKILFSGGFIPDHEKMNFHNLSHVVQHSVIEDIETVATQYRNLMLYWSFFAIGVFLKCQIINYLQSKYISSLLDGCYIQLFQSWIVLHFLGYTIVSIGELELEWYPLTVFGWAVFCSGKANLFSIHFAIIYLSNWHFIF